MDFNGTNQWINIGANAIANSTDFSITAWVNIDDLTGSDQHCIFSLLENFSPFNGTTLYIKRGTDPGRIGTSNVGTPVFDADVAITANQWDFVAIRGTRDAAPPAVALLGSWTSGLTHAVEAGSNRLLIFVAANENATAGEYLSSVTYGGESMTFIGVSEIPDAPVGNHIELWQLNEAGIAAAAGGTFVPTWSGGSTDVIYSSAFYGNVDQTSPTGLIETNSFTGGGNTITTATLTTGSGDMIVAGTTCGNTGTFTPNNAFIEGTDANGATNSLHTMYKTSTGVAETPSTTHTGANRLAIIAVEINTVLGSGGFVDVSVNGGTWTNLLTADTTSMSVSTGEPQNIARWNGDDFYTDGSIADIRYYNRLLTQAEIESIYDAKGMDGIVWGLQSRWPLDIGTIGTTPGTELTTAYIDSNEVLNTSTTTLTVTMPTHIDGDLLIVTMVCNLNGTSTPPTITPPVGWFTLDDAPLPTAPSVPRLAVYSKIADSEPATYDWTLSVLCGAMAHALSYRNVASTPNDIGIAFADDASPASPSLPGSDEVLILRVWASDDDEVPTPESDLYPTGTNGRQATEATTPANGYSLGTADEIDTSVVSRSWGVSVVEEWRCLTITFLANPESNVVDVTGPNNGIIHGEPIVAEHILRI